MPLSIRRLIVAAASSISLMTGVLAGAPTAAAVTCASPSTSTITETSGAVTRTYTRGIVTATSTCDWTVPPGVASLDLLVVGGGGGGGGGILWEGAGGGGGGGQVVETTLSVTSGLALALSVGLGGTAGRGGLMNIHDDSGMAPAGNGSPSTVTGTGVSVSSAGGLAGGNGTKTPGALTFSGAGGNSGSGSTGGQPDWDGGGGGAGHGGSGSPGVDIGGAGANGGTGGLGVTSSLSGSVQWYGAGGGGGGSYSPTFTNVGTGGIGGSGVGGNGNTNNGSSVVGLKPTSGATNTGSGGGGGAGVPNTSTWDPEGPEPEPRLNGASGAAGIVIVRYLIGPNLTGATTSGSPQVGSAVTAAASGATGTPAPSSTFQWQSSSTGTGGWSDIAGATSNSLVIDSAYVNQYLRAQVTVTNSSGSATTFTESSGPVAAAAAPPAPPTPPAAPTSPSPVPSPTAIASESSAPLQITTVAPTGSPVNVSPGKGEMILGGVVVPGTRTPGSPGGGFTLSGGGVVASASPPPSGFSSGGSTAVTLSGLSPDSQVASFLYSTPVSLGTMTVGADGVAKGRITIPASVPPGNHTLQFTGWTPSSEPVVLSAGITVKPQVKRVTSVVTFVGDSAVLSAAGRASVSRFVANSAAMVSPVRTAVGYLKSGADAQVKLAKARAKLVAAALRGGGMPGRIQLHPISPLTSSGVRSGEVVIVATG